jgi:hypothetical protein
MNCKQARNLFSARIDGELSPEEVRSLEIHVRECRAGCPEHWAEFETTVRMVRALPPIEAAPSFVGQVLDCVRAWEAQEAGRTIRVPLHALARPPVFGSGLSDRVWDRVRDGVWDTLWRERLSEWVGFLTGSRILAPVRLVGAVVLGVTGGFLLGQQGILSHRAASGPGLAQRTMVSAPAVPGSQAGPVRSMSDGARPFGDLAGGISSVREAHGREDSTSVTPDEIGNDPGGLRNRQVNAAPGDARPRVTITDGRPQITF